jgi:hypothetical protein
LCAVVVRPCVVWLSDPVWCHHTGSDSNTTQGRTVVRPLCGVAIRPCGVGVRTCMVLRGQRCGDAGVVCAARWVGRQAGARGAGSAFANGSILGTRHVSKIRVLPPRASVAHNGSADVLHFTDHSRRIRALRGSLLHASRTLFTSVLLPRQIQSPIHLRPTDFVATCVRCSLFWL